MLNVKRNELIHVLNFLEEKAEPAYQKALKEARAEQPQNVNTEELFRKATRAMEIEKTINALLDQVDTLQAEKDQQTSEILKVVDKIKGKSIKVGNIVLMIHETIQNNPQKVTFKYKHILDGILEVYDIEQRFLSRLKKKFRSITPAEKHVSKELEIQQEAQIKKLTKLIETKTGKKIQLTEGNLIDWIKEKGNALVSFFKSWYDSIAGKVDKLEAEAQSIGITSNKNRGDFGTPERFTPKTQALGESKNRLKESEDNKYERGAFVEIRLKTGTYNGIILTPAVVGKYKVLVNMDGKIQIGSFNYWNIKFIKQLQKDAQIEQYKSYLKKNNQPAMAEAMNRPDEQHSMGKRPVLDADQYEVDEAMNRPDEQRAMGKKPVLDADQHVNNGQENLKTIWKTDKYNVQKWFGEYSYFESLVKEYGLDEVIKEIKGVDDDHHGFIGESEEKYPWNDCIEDQKEKYGKEGAKKVCGSIKAKNENIQLKENEFEGMDPKKLIIGKKYAYKKNHKNNPKILTYLGGPKEYPCDFSVDTKTGKRKVTIPTWEIMSFLTPLTTGYEPTEDEGSLIETKKR